MVIVYGVVGVCNDILAVDYCRSSNSQSFKKLLISNSRQ